MRVSCDELLKSACESAYGGWEDNGTEAVARGVHIAFLVELLERHAGQEMIDVVRQTLKDLVSRVGAEEWVKANALEEDCEGANQEEGGIQKTWLTVGEMRKQGQRSTYACSL